LGEPQPKTGGVAPDFDTRFEGIEATPLHNVVV